MTESRNALPQPRVDIGKPAARVTLDHVWLAAALILVALRPLLTPIPPNDFWWHMATGRQIMADGADPARSTASRSRGPASRSTTRAGWRSC